MPHRRPPVYLLDANVFMEAHRRYYAHDICPGFWECLVHHCRAARLMSIDRVQAEIADGDALSAWVKKAPGSLFVSSGEMPVVEAFGEMMTWVQGNKQFLPGAKAEFARVADGWLAAYAKVHNLVLVTHEGFSAGARRTVPLPNICKQFGVAYQDTFTMLRGLEARFGWAAR